MAYALPFSVRSFRGLQWGRFQHPTRRHDQRACRDGEAARYRRDQDSGADGERIILEPATALHFAEYEFGGDRR